MDFPTEVEDLEAAKALNVSVPTIYNLLGRKRRAGRTRVPFMALCRACNMAPEFFLACLEGRDRAAGLPEAATVFGLSAPQMAGTAYKNGIAKPAAMLRKGWRYSAVQLGIFSPATSPVGHPCNSSCGED